MLSLENFKVNAKESVFELKKDYRSFIDFLKNNKFTIIITWFFILMAYGMKLFF